jgi:hypothetical protein
MAFPIDFEALLKAGYRHLRVDDCPVCKELVDVFSTPAKREIVLNSMTQAASPVVRHFETCGQPKKPPTIDLHMYGVTDPNHQLLAVGYDAVEGFLVCKFKTAEWMYKGVPEAEFMKLRNSPYAYRIFTTNIKGKYPAMKLE